MYRRLIAEDIKAVLDIKDIEETDKLYKILEDSLEILESIMHIEDHFDINIPIDHTIVTFGDLLNIVEKALNGKKASII